MVGLVIRTMSDGGNQCLDGALRFTALDRAGRNRACWCGAG